MPIIDAVGNAHPTELTLSSFRKTWIEHHSSIDK